MKEIKEIILAYEEAKKLGHQTALATVVDLEGSSYRRPGARMLVTDEGRMTGAISGGCLEGDALHKALMAMNQEKAKLVTYDTNDEDDSALGVQLGCNGIIQILIEPVNPVDPDNPIELLKKINSKRQESVLVTLYNKDRKNGNQPGTCMLFAEEKRISAISDQLLLNNIIAVDAGYAIRNHQSLFKIYNTGSENMNAFLEYFPPAVSLVIVGAGNDAKSVIEIADILGWETSIVDSRATHATSERFTSACQILVSKPEQVLERISVDRQTVFVLMTHNYNYDLAMLRTLLYTETLYIGVLGPKKKLHRMLEQIQADGIKLSRDQLNRIYGPVGLDIGAETAEEIALSVISEIKKVLEGQSGQSLRMKEDEIHLRKDIPFEEKRII